MLLLLHLLEGVVDISLSLCLSLSVSLSLSLSLSLSSFMWFCCLFCLLLFLWGFLVYIFVVFVHDNRVKHFDNQACKSYFPLAPGIWIIW